MTDAFRNAYYHLDLLVGFSAPVFFFLLYKTGRIDRLLWRFFWVGAALGAAWEIPIFYLSAESTTLPIIVWNRPLPLHYSAFMLSHTLWDGLLFALGILLIRGLFRGTRLDSFRWPELLVLIAWGQVSELLVELSSTLNDGWSYIEYPWNPVIFHFNGYNITWLLQAVWLAASIVYYFLLVNRPGRFIFSLLTHRPRRDNISLL